MSTAKVVSITAGRALDRRNDLIIEHLPLVAKIARKERSKLPPCFDIEDLIGWGTIGLIQAADTFDESRGVPFGAFARKRIRGEMRESVRKRNWVESTRQPIAEHDGCAAVGERYFGYQDTADKGAHQRLEAAVEQRYHRDLVNDALAALPRRQAELIVMHYREHMDIKDIGPLDGFRVKSPRMSQLHTDALQRMRAHFALRGLRRVA